jgi:DegV family protein with EDD domain
MIKLVVDSTAGIEKSYIEKNGITVVPLKILFSDEEYTEGFPGEYDKFYEKIEKTKEFPKTSLPSPDLFKKAYSDLTKNGDEVICVTISLTLSGTYNSAKLAQEEFTDKVSVIDSNGCCQNIFFLVEEMLDLIKEGKSRQEIVEIITALRDKTCMHFVPESLDYLKHGGRISLLSASIGSILKIKPILQFKAGKLSNIKKAIGMNRAINELVNLISDNAKKIFVVCIGKSTFYDTLKAKVTEKFKNISVRFGEISPVMGAHVGPGTLGIACLIK